MTTEENQSGEGAAMRRIRSCGILVAQRRAVGRHIGFRLSADPVWDMFLDLYLAEHRGQAISLTSLSTASNVPPTTALRSIKLLTNEGWLTRSLDPNDARRIHVALTGKARSRIENLLDELATTLSSIV